MVTLDEAPRSARQAPAWRSALIGAGIYLAFVIAMTVFNANPPQLSQGAFVLFSVLTSIGYPLILVVSILFMCKMQLRPLHAFVAMMVSLAAFLVLNPTVWVVVNSLFHGEGLSAVLVALKPVEMSSWQNIIVPFMLICTGVFGGQLLSHVIRERSLLMPVALVSAFIDLFGVYWGPVNFMSESAPAAVTGMATAQTAAAAIPPDVKGQLSGAMHYLANIVPPDNIGIGDFVFLAFFLACAFRLGFSARRTMWAIYGGLLLTSLIMSLDGVRLLGHPITIEYLPGLVFISGSALLVNLRAWKLSRQEWLMTGIIVLALSAVLGTLVYRAEARKKEEAAREIEVAQYVIKDASCRASIQKTLSSIAKETTQYSVVPMAAGVVFVGEQGKKPVAAQWQLLIVLKPKSAGGQILETLAQGQWIGSGWLVERLPDAAPRMTVEVLRKRGKFAGDGTQALAALKGIPASAWSILDKMDEISGVKGKSFTVKFGADKVEVVTADNSVMKSVPYAAGGK